MASRGAPTPAVRQPPPSLPRSRSGARRLPNFESPPSSPTSNTNTVTAISAARRAASATRSRSTAKSRAQSDGGAPSLHLSLQKDSKKSGYAFNETQRAAGLVRQCDAGPSSYRGLRTRAASPARSPSAWALSSGRSRAATEGPDPVGRVKKTGGGLGFLRQKKAPSPQDEAVHQLRILFCRRLQWRFVNARAKAAAGATESNAERKLFNVWMRIGELRKVVTAKRALLQRLNLQMKLELVLRPQLWLLRGWDDFAGRRNLEFLAKCTGLLRAACTSLPLVDGARADIGHLCTRISEATYIMEDVRSATAGLHRKADGTSSLLGVLAETLNREKAALADLTEIARGVALLEMQEMSLRAHLLQAEKESDVGAGEQSKTGYGIE